MKRKIFFLLLFVCLVGASVYTHLNKTQIKEVQLENTIENENKEYETIYVYDTKTKNLVPLSIDVDKKVNDVSYLIDEIIKNTKNLSSTIKVTTYEIDDNNSKILLVKFNNEIYQISNTSLYSGLTSSITRTIREHFNFSGIEFQIEM